MPGWKTIDKADTPDGPLELRTSGPGKFIITVSGRVLMNGMANLSELALATMACELIKSRKRPRVLIGGLGMGFTLRAALDALPKTAEVVVAELNPVVLKWCRGTMFELTNGAVADQRVEVRLGDVAETINGSKGFDAIILDLYEGPHAATQGKQDPLFGADALKRTRAALKPHGVLAIWGEERDQAFEKRIEGVGFQLEIKRPGKGGRRHVVYLARPAS